LKFHFLPLYFIFYNSIIKAMDKQFADLIANSPKSPGVYSIYDADGALLYVGKAKNLNARLRQYLDASRLEWHKRIMRGLASRVEWRTTATEAEALILEERIIKTQKPKYNIMLTDGKMYPMLALTKHEFPRLAKFRGKISQKKDVFGPYPSVSTLNDAIKTIQKVCQIRTCSDSFMRNRARPCLLYQIGRCSAPCMPGDGRLEYGENVRLARRILSGDAQVAAAELSREMQAAANRMDFERAAGLRNKIAALSVTAMRGKHRGLAEAHAGSLPPVLELENWLGLSIERAAVFDNSHLFGKNPVGAMIVFDRTGFIKSEYRHFKLVDKSRAGNDISMMEEFIQRAVSKGSPVNLIIVDGGRTQWNAAQKVLNGSIPVLGIAKGEIRNGDEHFILPNGSEDRNVPKDSPLFLLLRRVRDEAHRFAVSFHRSIRAKSAIASALDEIEGVGAARKRMLLHHFGGVRQIADSTPADLARARGISKSMAEKIYLHFHPENL
jgi:excinuclease ABC subunit C